MSLLGDIFAGIRHVTTLDDRIARVEREVELFRPDLAQLNNRLTRIETMIEMAQRGPPRLDRG